MEAFDVLASSSGASVADETLTITVNATVVLDGELDCSTEREITRRISRLVESADVIHIDARQVAFMDSAGVRTLVLAKRDAVKNGTTLTVEISRPGPLERIFGVAGLNEWLG